MRIHTSNIKAIVAFMLVLCLSMTFLLPAVSASVMATHTHVCPDEEYKDDCVDVKECCTICLNFYNAKSRNQTIYGDLTNELYAVFELPSVNSTTEFPLADTVFSTPLSLRVRLNN